MRAPVIDFPHSLTPSFRRRPESSVVLRATSATKKGRIKRPFLQTPAAIAAYFTATGIPARLPEAMRSAHSFGPVLCTEMPLESTATVTGMSFTSNS